MVITISATLTPEWIDTLSKAKGYESEIHTMTDAGFVHSANSQTPEDFIRQVYQSMIENDAIDVFVKYAKEQRAELERIEEEKIRTSVSNSITSSVWS